MGVAPHWLLSSSCTLTLQVFWRRGTLLYDVAWCEHYRGRYAYRERKLEQLHG